MTSISVFAAGSIRTGNPVFFILSSFSALHSAFLGNINDYKTLYRASNTWMGFHHLISECLLLEESHCYFSHSPQLLPFFLCLCLRAEGWGGSFSASGHFRAHAGCGGKMKLFLSWWRFIWNSGSVFSVLCWCQGSRTWISMGLKNIRAVIFMWGMQNCLCVFLCLKLGNWWTWRGSKGNTRKPQGEGRGASPALLPWEHQSLYGVFGERVAMGWEESGRALRDILGAG